MVQDNDGLLISQKWRDSKVSASFKFEVQNTMFSKGSIDYIDVVKERQGESSSSDDINKTDRDMYNEWKVKTPEEKAERLTGFIKCFGFVNHYEPKPELVALLKQALVKFFIANPNRTYADYVTYKPYLFKNDRSQPLTFAATVMVGIFARTLANDYQNSKYNK